MGEKLPFLDKTGVIRLWQHILAKIGVKADRAELEELEETLTQKIDNLELITTDDIDTICGASIKASSEVIL
jgi:hypothetical protein